MWIGVGGFRCESVLVLVIFERQRRGFWCGSAVEVCDFGLDRWWVSGGVLWILVWIGEVGLLWFE